MFKAMVSLFGAATVVAAMPASATVEGALIPAAPEYQKSWAQASRMTERSATATNPTIVFYAGQNCASGGIALSVVDRAFQTCLTALPSTYQSVIIDNPDGTWLPYTIWVSFTGNTCPTGIQQIPQTNTCYNLTPSGNGWYRQNTGGGTF